MDDTATMNRIRDLESFANSPAAESREVATTPQTALPNQVVYGAQRVAVYRDEKKVLERLKVLAAAAGGEWYYRWSTQGKGGKTEWVEGPSIKLADDLARIFGNCDIDTRCVDMGDNWLFLSRFIDLETGYSRTRPFQQRKSQLTIKGDSGRARDIAFQIGVSKAERNVIVHSLRTFSDYAFQEAKNSLIEKIGKNIVGYRDRVLAGIDDQGIDRVRIERVIGRAAKDWLAPDIAKVIASMKAIADGMQTWDEAFPPNVEKSDPKTGEVLDKFVAKDEVKAETMEAETGDATDTDNETQQSQQQELVSPSDDTAAATDAGANGVPQAVAPASTNSGDAPNNDATYTAYAEAWIDTSTNAEECAARWSREKTMRNKCNVSPENRDALDARKKAKVAQLKGK